MSAEAPEGILEESGSCLFGSQQQKGPSIDWEMCEKSRRHEQQVVGMGRGISDQGRERNKPLLTLVCIHPEHLRACGYYVLMLTLPTNPFLKFFLL